MWDVIFLTRDLLTMKLCNITVIYYEWKIKYGTLVKS